MLYYTIVPLAVNRGTTFATEQLFNELRLVDPERGIAVEIGNDVWIGEGAFLVGGIRIGDGAVVLAHAVVTKDIPHTLLLEVFLQRCCVTVMMRRR